MTDRDNLFVDEQPSDEEALFWEPLTGAEMVEQGLIGAWADLDLPDGQTWLSQVRELMWNEN